MLEFLDDLGQRLQRLNGGAVEYRAITVDGVSNLLIVGSDGSIKSRHVKSSTHNGGYYIRKAKTLSQYTHTSGYKYITLGVNGCRHSLYTHRLVAQAFHNNLLGLPMVNHKNGNKTDNRVCNLEWVTAKQNTAHAIETGLISYGVKNTSLFTENDILLLHVAKELGYSVASIAACMGITTKDTHLLDYIGGRRTKNFTQDCFEATLKTSIDNLRGMLK